MKIPEGIIIAKVRKENIDDFRIFDPYDCLDLAGLPGTIVLGALDDGFYRAKNRPVGVFIATTGKSALTIEWMATDPDYRNLEIGDAFIEAAFLIAKQKGLSEVEARIRSKEPGNEGYFRYGFFETDKKDFGEYRLLISDAMVKFRIPEENGDDNICTVSKLVGGEVQALDEFLLEAPISHLLVPGISCGSNIDTSLSLVWMEDGRPAGALIFISSGQNHYPVAIAGESDYEIKALIGYAAQHIKLSLPQEDTLIVRCNSIYTSTLAKSIFGSEGLSATRKLTCRVEEYEF